MLNESNRSKLSNAASAMIEEGSALEQLGSTPERRDRRPTAERFDVIVIGAGQAGLSVGYFLRQRGLNFVIVDGAARIGESWRKRWDSLRLFNMARHCGLQGLPFPADPDYFPTKDEMGDYLESYAQHFELPVRLGQRVERLYRRDGRYVVHVGGQVLEAAQVVVAMASYQKPKVPDLAAQLDPSIVQLHSSAYKNPAQLQPGDALLVGAGNSGAEIALDVAEGRKVWLSGREVGHVPVRIASWFGRKVFAPLLMRVVFHRLLTLSTPFGRKVRGKVLHKGGPLVRTRPTELSAAGVERATRVVGVRDGKPMLQDGRVLDVRNVVWCSGFHPGFSWVELPVFDEHGNPRQQRGVVTEAPGLYFVGLHFLYAMSSTMIHGVGRDAQYVVQAVLAHAAHTARSDAPTRLAAASAI